MDIHITYILSKMHLMLNTPIFPPLSLSFSIFPESAMTFAPSTTINLMIPMIGR